MAWIDSLKWLSNASWRSWSLCLSKKRVTWLKKVVGNRFIWRWTRIKAVNGLCFEELPSLNAWYFVCLSLIKTRLSFAVRSGWKPQIYEHSVIGRSSWGWTDGFRFRLVYLCLNLTTIWNMILVIKIHPTLTFFLI